MKKNSINRIRTKVLKMTRWSKANPRKAQLLITGLQVVLLPLGIFLGNNLKELGYDLSYTTALVFGIILLIGFLYVPFLPQRRTIVLPKQGNRQRFAFISIALSAFALMVFFGNKLQDKYPNSLIARSVKAIDQAIFPNDIQYTAPSDLDLKPVRSEQYDQTFKRELSENIVFASFSLTEPETIILPGNGKESKESLKAEKKAKKFEKKKARLMKLIKKQRLSFAGMSIVLAVILIVLLCIPVCAGVCLIISGSVGGVLGGIALLALSLFGIVKIGKAVRKRKEPKQ